MDKRRFFTEEEDSFIRQHYLATANRDIAATLGRSVKSIRKRAARIGCPRKKAMRRWSPEEDQVILASKGRPLAEIAEELRRDPSDLLKRAHKLGFVSWRRPDGGMYIDSHGYYVRRFERGKPIWEHRAVAEELLGRKLGPSEIVHHIDTDKRNNDPGNLHVFRNPAEHARCHASLDALLTEGSDVPKLLRMGRIQFEKDKGVYVCATKAF